MDHSDELWVRAMVEILEAKITQSNTLTESVSARVDLNLKNHDDQEKRIRDLEQFKWKVIGAAAVVGGIAGVSAGFLV
jgi:hypothetical protein